jgi:spore maturation protein CgeB
MRFVVFGLTASSSPERGHETQWRDLSGALARMGHVVTFFERDAPCFAAHRDLPAPRQLQLRLYPSWADVASDAAAAVRGAHVAMVTSLCPDALEATELVLASPAAVRCFYDLDTPLTLARLRRGERVDHLGPGGLTGFDLVLSSAGGAALEQLRERLGARVAAALLSEHSAEVRARQLVEIVGL